MTRSVNRRAELGGGVDGAVARLRLALRSVQVALLERHGVRPRPLRFTHKQFFTPGAELNGQISVQMNATL
ncbi:MAG: hypothetical protein ABIP93_10220 [Gemmatimonadaceae bacterium]